MSWQQIVIIIWLSLLIIIQIINDGKEKKGRYKAAPGIIELAFIAYVLYSGGFWN